MPPQHLRCKRMQTVYLQCLVCSHASPVLDRSFLLCSRVDRYVIRLLNLQASEARLRERCNAAESAAEEGRRALRAAKEEAAACSQGFEVGCLLRLFEIPSSTGYRGILLLLWPNGIRSVKLCRLASVSPVS